MLRLLLLGVLLPTALPYPYFQGYIPNGANVPNPCLPGELWPGVGHKLVGGTGDRNPFGLAFAANNFVWNPTICQEDSDGDGRTNGQELGDPSCVWSASGNQPPQFTKGLTHPGICEPLNATMCTSMNSWLTCPKPFVCPALSLPTTESMSIQFPLEKVPAQLTTYICVGFALPNDTEYQIIGTTPLINNSAILHHMILYGCNAPLTETQMTTPFTCGMAVPSCQSMMGLWAVGSGGQCLSDEFGFPMGPNGYQYAVLQLHWNNAALSNSLMDASGMKIYYTSQLRPYNGQIVMVGQNYLNIPPNQPSVQFSGSCTSNCSSLMTVKTVYIASAALHMHLLGSSGDIILIRSNQSQNTLEYNPAYDYNTPLLSSFSTPIPWNAGDSIRVDCVYNSLDKNTTTYWGESTEDEMCYGFITIYPAVPGFDQCTQFQNLDICSLSDALTYVNCDLTTFSALLTPVAEGCTIACSPTCLNIIADVMGTGCLNGALGMFINQFWPIGLPKTGPLLKLIAYCGQKMGPTTTTTATPSTPKVKSPNGAEGLRASGACHQVALAAAMSYSVWLAY